MACPNSISCTHYVHATCGLRYTNCVSIKAQTEEEMRGEDEREEERARSPRREQWKWTAEDTVWGYGAASELNSMGQHDYFMSG